MADLSDIQSSQSVKVAGASSTGTETTFAEVLSIDPSGTEAGIVVRNIPSGTQAVSGTLAIGADIYSSYSPDFSSHIDGTGQLSLDASGRLETHSTVTSDEGSFRDDFTGSSIYLTVPGTVTFTNGSNVVTGSGTTFTSLNFQTYIKLSTDSDASYALISSIDSDTQITLASNYSGSSASGTALNSNWLPSGSVSVGSSLVTLASGTTNGNTACLMRAGDYLPYIAYGKFAISQRIANQEVVFGFVDQYPNPSKQVLFSFSGTDSTKVNCISSFGLLAGDIQTTNATLPSSAVSSSQNKFEISLSSNIAAFLVNGSVVASHADHLPGPYDNLTMILCIRNTAAAASNTNIVCDGVFFSNVDQLEITNNFKGEPIPTQLYGVNSSTNLIIPLQLDQYGNLIVSPLGGVGAGFSFGDVSTSATTAVAMRRTAYTEQTTNGQRSFASANANDAAAGTGARQVTFTYYDQTGAGPYTETVTLNGTTGVNTVATNICYIEKINVSSVGSGNSNAGIITMYSAINKGGVAIGTIGAGANQTFWAHHYVANGKTCRVSGISGSTDQTSSAYCLLFLKAKTINSATAVELQVSDSVRVYGGASETARNYNSPIIVTGPSRVIMYAQPSSNSAQNTFGSFDYSES